MNLTIDPDKLFASYNAMMHTEMTEDDRAALWDICRAMCPDMTNLIYDQYNAAADSKDSHQLDRTTGATFLFLSLINSITDKPVVSLDGPPNIDLSFTKAYKLPSFGFLKPLE